MQVSLSDELNRHQLLSARCLKSSLSSCTAILTLPEGQTDRHNMMLFLQNDTKFRPNPSGFDLPRRNIFDPEDDPVYPALEAAVAAKPAADTNVADKSSHPENGQTKLDSVHNDDEDKKVPASEEGAPKSNGCKSCARRGCDQKPRFDSVFCSDSCGVSTLESDLLLSLQYASKLHPAVLRM